MSLLRPKQPSPLALVALMLPLCAVGARADVLKMTFINVTFSAECVGGTGVCPEVINGSGLFDTGKNLLYDVSMQLTGTLNASLDSWYNATGPNPCSGWSYCLSMDFLYDSGAASSYNPIEFGPSLPTLYAPTPEALLGGAKGTLLVVPPSCGGDQLSCETAGGFPGGSAYELTSGTYTSVDESETPVNESGTSPGEAGAGSAPEPCSGILLAAGFAQLGVLSRRRLRAARKTLAIGPPPGGPFLAIGVMDQRR